MIIEQIDIKSFGKITDLTMTFSAGVNVIEGDNESGKSTIAAFIKYMLYGFDTAPSADDVDERRRRLNWNTGICQGTMTVKVGVKRYIISRTTVPTTDSGKLSYKEDSSIIDMETGAPAFGKLCAGEVFFGVDRDLFENTAFLGQLSDSKINEGSVKESIENILFSGSEKINNQRAAARVEERMHSILHPNNMGGAIIDLEKKRAQYEERMKQSDIDNKQILAKEIELHEIRTRKEAAESTYKKFTDLDERYKNAMIIQSFDNLHDLEVEAENKAQVYNDYIAENTRAGYAPDEKYLTDIVNARMAVNDTYHTLTEASDEYSRQRNAAGITRESEEMIELCDERGGEDAVLGGATELYKTKIKSILVGILGGLALVSAVVLAVVLSGALGAVLSGLAFAAAAAGVVYFVYFFMKSNKALAEVLSAFRTPTFAEFKLKIAAIAQDRKKRDDMLKSTEAARFAVDDARNNYETAKNQLKNVILRWGEEPPANDLNLFLDNLEAKVKTYLEGKAELYREKENIDLTVRDIRRTLADKSEINIRAQVTPLKRKAMAGVNHDEIITGISDCRAKIAAEEKLALDVESELFALKARAGEPGDYFVGASAIDEKIDELRDKHKAYYIALKAIESASDNLRLEISPRLGEYSTKLMEIMTDKKYDSIDVSDGLKVTFTDETGEKRSIDFLSGGTRDLTYVAVRMALIDMLYTEKPPVSFDESFAHQDDKRAEAMMKAIGALRTEGIQSFIFTCHKREAALASRLEGGAEIYKLTEAE